jgi:hypothetical protein
LRSNTQENEECTEGVLKETIPQNTLNHSMSTTSNLHPLMTVCENLTVSHPPQSKSANRSKRKRKRKRNIQKGKEKKTHARRAPPTKHTCGTVPRDANADHAAKCACGSEPHRPKKSSPGSPCHPSSNPQNDALRGVGQLASWVL